MDVGPFREHRDFRLLLIAGTVFYLGGMMTYVAIPYQIYTITGSNLAVGAVGLVELVPLIVFGLYGGALADHVDRRLLLIWTGIAQAAFTAWLAINAFSSHPRLWEIFLVSGLLASASALQRPSREALLPRTVRHDEMVAANALSSFGMQGGRPGRSGDRRRARGRRSARGGATWSTSSACSSPRCCTPRCAATPTSATPSHPA